MEYFLRTAREHAIKAIIGVLIAGAVAGIAFYWNAIKTVPIPKGAVLAFNLSECPETLGWNEYEPARGKFIRGIDPTGSNEIDPDGKRAPGSSQEDEFKDHTHGVRVAYALGGDNTHQYYSLAAPPPKISGEEEGHIKSKGGLETRPKNVALLYCIKAK